MKVQIINKSHHPLPAYATTQSAGMDIRANLSEPVEIKPLERKLSRQDFTLPCPTDTKHRCVRGVAWPSSMVLPY